MELERYGERGMKVLRACRGQRRIYRGFTVAVLTVAAFAVVICAALGALVSCNGGVKYRSNGDGTCYVSRGGNATGDVYIEEYHGGERVVAVGDGAFRGSSLRSVTLSASVEIIGDGAFEGCASLESVRVTGGLQSIGEYAFKGCISLGSVEIPEGVTELGRGAYFGCTSLESVTLPGSLAVVGEGAFGSCSALARVSFAEGIERIGGGAFSWCGALAYVGIPNTVTDLGEDCFLGCGSLAGVDVSGSTLESIGRAAFKYCRSLADIDIPDSLASLGDEAFYECRALECVSIPSGLVYIGRSAFSYCTSLREISVDAENPNYSSIDGVLYSKDCSVLLQYALGKPDTEFYIPNKIVLEIGEKAFACCKLEAIYIPAKVKRIGSGAFLGCREIEFWCKDKREGDGWADDWNQYDCDVYWKRGSIGSDEVW